MNNLIIIIFTLIAGSITGSYIGKKIKEYCKRNNIYLNNSDKLNKIIENQEKLIEELKDKKG